MIQEWGETTTRATRGACPTSRSWSLFQRDTTSKGTGIHRAVGKPATERRSTALPALAETEIPETSRSHRHNRRLKRTGTMEEAAEAGQEAGAAQGQTTGRTGTKTTRFARLQIATKRTRARENRATTAAAIAGAGAGAGVGAEAGVGAGAEGAIAGDVAMMTGKERGLVVAAIAAVMTMTITIDTATGAGTASRIGREEEGTKKKKMKCFRAS